jgi:hypothetical protein
MAKQTILTGTAANDKTGDTIRTAFTKVNANFTELYNIGVQGTQGAQGLQGITGAQGVQGRQGITGIGTQGTQGIQGASGSGGGDLAFDSNGDLIINGNIVVGVAPDNAESHFVIDSSNYWTSIQWKNFTSPQDPAAEPFECQSQLLRVFSGTNAINGHEELVAVSAVRNTGTNYNGLMFSTSDGKIPDSPYNDGIGTRHNWILKGDGSLILPQGSVIDETSTTLVLTPPSAAAGQSLVIRPTAAAWIVTSSGYIVYDSPITISVTQNSGGTYYGTVNYEITTVGNFQTLGRTLTGSVVFDGTMGPVSQDVTWTIPANSDITSFTFTLTTVEGTFQGGPTVGDPALYYNFESNAMPTGAFVTVTNNGITNSEHSHIHLISGNLETTDIYLGDDSQYVKIEKNGGDVVIGTNLNTNTWTFGTDGNTILPNGKKVTFGEQNGDAFIEAVMGFRISSREGIALNAVDATDPDNLINRGWYFSPQGKVYFPNLSVDLHNGGVQTGQVLQFGDESYQAIITGPTPTGNNNAPRLIIQGQKGSGTGEGGDVYVWAGDADTNGGDIKIYAGNADNVSSGNGGYINIDAGNGFNYGGQLTLRGGDSNQYGGSVSITSGYGTISSGNITANSATGHFEINNSTCGWTFKNNGAVVYPTNAIPTTSKGAAGDVVGSVVFGPSYIYYCIQSYNDGAPDIWKRVAWSNDTW